MDSTLTRWKSGLASWIYGKWHREGEEKRVMHKEGKERRMER